MGVRAHDVRARGGPTLTCHRLTTAQFRQCLGQVEGCDVVAAFGESCRVFTCRGTNLQQMAGRRQKGVEITPDQVSFELVKIKTDIFIGGSIVIAPDVADIVHDPVSAG